MDPALIPPLPIVDAEQPVPVVPEELDPIGQEALNAALYRACGTGTSHIVSPDAARFRYLLGIRANPREAQGPGLRGWRVIHRAAHNGSLETATLLVNELGLDYQQRTPWGGDALMYSASRDHLDVALFFISKGANPHIDCNNGRTAISHYAAYAKPHPGVDTALARGQLLSSAFAQGPHPDACWARRWPLLFVLTGHGIFPSLGRLAAQAAQMEMNRLEVSAEGENRGNSQSSAAAAWMHCLSWCWPTAVHPGIRDVAKQRRLFTATLGARDTLQYIVQYL